MEVPLMVSKDRLWKRIELAVDSPRLLHCNRGRDPERPGPRLRGVGDDVGPGLDVFGRHPAGRRHLAARRARGLRHVWGRRGTTERGRTWLRLCDGIDCRRCALGRIRRPISDHFDPETGRFWHTPYFASIAPCEFCQATALRLTRESFPDDLRPASPVPEVLAEARRATR